jgi:hypothetical protein
MRSGPLRWALWSKHPLRRHPIRARTISSGNPPIWRGRFRGRSRRGGRHPRSGEDDFEAAPDEGVSLRAHRRGKLRCTGATWSDAVVIFPGEVLAFQNTERQAHALRAPAPGKAADPLRRHPILARTISRGSNDVASFWCEKCGCIQTLAQCPQIETAVPGLIKWRHENGGKAFYAPGYHPGRGWERDLGPMTREQAPKCGARTRAGTPCQRSAIRGRTRCRLHGGLSPGAPRGAKNGNFRNGDWTSEAIKERKWLRSLVRSFAKTGTTE